MSGRKQIVITGASSGIGAALTCALAADGHTVHACARRGERLSDVTLNNTVAFGDVCDVSQEEQVVAFVAGVRERTPRVDALIHCAGGFGAIGPLLQTDSRAWLKTIETNLYGAYLMIKHVVPLMAGSSSPRIVTFAGGGSFSPFPNYSGYAASKAAIVRLTEIVALELASRGITVNAIAPGFVATEIHEETLRSGAALAGEDHFERTQQLLRDGAVPMEVPVACVQFLLSDQAAVLTGKTLSASFDPWGTPTFVESIPQINQSDVYTLRRMNLVNMPDSPLRRLLSTAHQEMDTRKSRGVLK